MRTDLKLFLSATVVYAAHNLHSTLLYGLVPFNIITLVPYLLLLAFWNKAPRLVKAVIAGALVLPEIEFVRRDALPKFQRNLLSLESLGGLLLVVSMVLLVVTAVVLIREHLSSKHQRRVST